MRIQDMIIQNKFLDILQVTTSFHCRYDKHIFNILIFGIKGLMR